MFFLKHDILNGSRVSEAEKALVQANTQGDGVVAMKDAERGVRNSSTSYGVAHGTSPLPTMPW